MLAMYRSHHSESANLTPHDQKGDHETWTWTAPDRQRHRRCLSGRDGCGHAVVDAGLPGHWRELLAKLAAMGRSLDDVRGLILTHGDSDHIGFAERLRRDHGVPVFVHTADAARACGEKPPATPRPPMRLRATLGFFGYALRKEGRTTHLTDVVEVHDDQVLDLPGNPRIIAMPGHSPGSITIHVPAVDALFVGDALTTRHVLTGRRGPQPAPSPMSRGRRWTL